MGSRCVAFLRGINVGATKRMTMAELREVFLGLGHSDVKTLLQSGNVVFTASGKASALEAQLHEGILARFGFDVAVVVRTASELRAIVAKNPLPEAAQDGAKLLVAFLSARLKASTVAGLDPAAFAPERFVIAGREIYLSCPNGVQESKLFALLNGRRFEVAATARNWNTVTKVLALAES
jgi:uncharacterized protein (DUF1697 family)